MDANYPADRREKPPCKCTCGNCLDGWHCEGFKCDGR